MGKALTEKAESEARKRGVRKAYLYSLSFQTPGFHRRLGNREVSRLDDFPKGHSRPWLEKPLGWPRISKANRRRRTRRPSRSSGRSPAACAPSRGSGSSKSLSLPSDPA